MASRIEKVSFQEWLHCESKDDEKSLTISFMLELEDPICQYMLGEVSKLERELGHIPGVNIVTIVQSRFDIREIGDLQIGSFPATMISIEDRNKPVILQRPGWQDDYALFGPLSSEQLVNLVRFVHQTAQDAKPGQKIYRLLCDI